MTEQQFLFSRDDKVGSKTGEAVGAWRPIIGRVRAEGHQREARQVAEHSQWSHRGFEVSHRATDVQKQLQRTVPTL